MSPIIDRNVHESLREALDRAEKAEAELEKWVGAPFVDRLLESLGAHAETVAAERAAERRRCAAIIRATLYETGDQATITAFRRKLIDLIETEQP